MFMSDIYILIHVDRYVKRETVGERHVERLGENMGA